MAEPLQRVSLTYDFTIQNLTGPWADQKGSGFFCYTGPVPTGNGLEILGGQQNLVILFRFQDENYTEADEEAGAEFPLLMFQDGDLLGLNYVARINKLRLAISSDASFPIETIGGDVFIYDQKSSAVSCEGQGVVTYRLRAASAPPEVY